MLVGFQEEISKTKSDKFHKYSNNFHNKFYQTPLNIFKFHYKKFKIFVLYRSDLYKLPKRERPRTNLLVSIRLFSGKSVKFHSVFVLSYSVKFQQLPWNLIMFRISKGILNSSIDTIKFWSNSMEIKKNQLKFLIRFAEILKQFFEILSNAIKFHHKYVLT